MGDSYRQTGISLIRYAKYIMVILSALVLFGAVLSFVSITFATKYNAKCIELTEENEGLRDKLKIAETKESNYQQLLDRPDIRAILE